MLSVSKINPDKHLYVSALLAATITIALLLIDFCFIHIHIENNDLLANIFFSGLIYKPFGEVYYRDYFLIGPLLANLYSCYPSIHWLIILQHGATATAVFLLLFSISYYVFVKQFPVLLALILLLAISVILNINLVNFNHNRTAFLVCASGITGYYVFRHHVKKRYLLLSSCLLWFTIGVLFRLEASIAILAMLCMFLLLIYKFNVLRTTKGLLPFSMPVFALLLYGLIHILYDKQLYYALEPDVEYEILDRNNVKPLSAMTTTRDSARYIAIQNWMLSDLESTPVSYMRTLINKPNNLFHRFFFFIKVAPNAEGSSIIKNIIAFAKTQWQVGLFCFILLILIMFYTHGAATYIAILFFIGGCTIAMSSGIVKVVPRVIEPIMAIVCIVLSLFFIHHYNILRKPIRIINISFIIFSVFLSASLVKQTIVQSRQADKIEAENQAYLNKINSITNKTLIVSMANFTFMQMPLLHSTNLFNGKKIVPIQLGQYADSKEFKEIITSMTGCNPYNFICRFEFLAAHKNQVLIIAEEGNLAFFKYYLKAMYNFDFRYSEINPEYRYGDISMYELN